MPTFDTPGSISLQVKLPSGRVVVTTADEPRTTVEVIPLGRRGQDAIDEIEVTMEERAGRHVVRIEQRDRFRWGPIQISWGGDFECRVTCPPGTDLDLSGASTDVRVDGELGAVSARTASGDIRLQTVAGVLQVKTASGDVSVGTLGGQGTIAAELGVSTTSGDVDLKGVQAGEVRVQTVSGDVRVGIARGTRVWVDAASVSGDLGSELGLEGEEATGESEGEVVPLHVKTVSGDVSVVRAAAALAP